MSSFVLVTALSTKLISDEFGRNGGNVESSKWNRRDSRMAMDQPVRECLSYCLCFLTTGRNQCIQCKPIDPLNQPTACNLIPHGHNSFMFHCPRSQLTCSPSQESTTYNAYNPLTPRPLRSRRLRRCSQCLPNADGGNLPRHLCARSRRHHSRHVKESRCARRVRDGCVTGLECNAGHGYTTSITVETTANRMAETASSNDYSCQLGLDSRRQFSCTSLCNWRIPPATTNSCFESGA